MKRKPKTSTLKSNAWKAFSRWIRLKYANESGLCFCVTCGKAFPWTEIQAGHFVSRRHNACFINEDVVRPQCSACNAPNIGNGRPAEFAVYLVQAEGKTIRQVEELLNLRHKTVVMKDADWVRLAEEYNNKADAVRELKKL